MQGSADRSWVVIVMYSYTKEMNVFFSPKDDVLQESLLNQHLRQPNTISKRKTNRMILILESFILFIIWDN